MNGVNLQASMHNLSQMSRHQHDGHNTPIVNQEKNAEAAKEEAARRIDKPVEPDEAEGKVVDPENKNKNGSHRRKKKKEKNGKKKKKKSPGNRGHFVDFSA